MALLSELGCENFVRDRVIGGATHKEVAAELRRRYPGLSGLSDRSIRRFCCINQIHRSSRLCVQSLDEIVEQAVSQVSFTARGSWYS